MNTPSLLLGIALAATATTASASITYTDWTSATTGAAGSAAGTITLPSAQVIGLSYSGDVSFAQTDGTGVNYWAQSSPAPYNNNAYNAYSGVANMPADSDIVALRRATGAASNVLSFSQPVTDPILLVLSIGQPGYTVRYDFDQDFTILSSGNGHWGGSAAGSLFEEAGDVLRGVEGHGAIQFLGTYSTISWTVDPAENWHGFTVGIPSAQRTPDAGSTVALLGLTCLGLGAFSRRSR